MAGSIPVVFAGARYKQCDSPAENNFRSIGAPFLYVDSWEDFPAQLAEALALGVDALQVRAASLLFCLLFLLFVLFQLSTPIAGESERASSSSARLAVVPVRPEPSTPERRGWMTRRGLRVMRACPAGRSSLAPFLSARRPSLCHSRAAGGIT